MVDFRYHALSLVAVFMALGVGILLGVAIGDSGLASSARDALRDGLRGDVERVRADARALAAEVERRDRFERRAHPELVAGRLRGKQVGLVFLGDRDGAVHDHVRAAIAPAGGELAFVVDAVGDTDAQGRRAAEAIARGGADAIVVARTDPGERTEFDDGVVDALRAAGLRLAGVELSTTTPSQTGWYRSHELSSIDNLDEPAGMTSLVLVLAGNARGAYGSKHGAGTLVPDALGAG